MVVVLLAAGAGNRFQAIEHKLLARLTATGPTILEQALTRALDASLGPVLIIIGALDEAALRADPALARLLDDDRITVRHNPDWAAGQATSVQVAVTSAAALGADAIVVGLADQPLIDVIAWQQVAQGLGPNHGRNVRWPTQQPGQAPRICVGDFSRRAATKALEF